MCITGHRSGTFAQTANCIFRKLSFYISGKPGRQTCSDQGSYIICASASGLYYAVPCQVNDNLAPTACASISVFHIIAWAQWNTIQYFELGREQYGTVHFSKVSNLVALPFMQFTVVVPFWSWILETLNPYSTLQSIWCCTHFPFSTRKVS